MRKRRKPESILFFLAFAAVCPAQPDNSRFGFAVAGAEWGAPYPSNPQMDYYAGTGMSLIRFPISWERIQPGLNGGLDAAEVGRLKNLLRQAKDRNLKVLVDVHNYCRRKVNGSDKLIGSPEVPLASIANLWTRLATELKDAGSVWGYGLMNEPHDLQQSSLTWFTIAQALIRSIREIDAVTPIVVGGESWSSANSWPKASDNLKNLVDPSGRIIYEAHCYFDRDGSSMNYASSPTERADLDVGIKRVKPFVDWIKANNVRGFVGEYGIPRNDAGWYPALERYLAYLEANCINGTYWAAGGSWGGYDLSLEPKNGIDAPQMAILKAHRATAKVCPTATGLGEFRPVNPGHVNGRFSLMPFDALRTAEFAEAVAWKILSLDGAVLRSGYGTHCDCPACGGGLMLLSTEKPSR